MDAALANRHSDLLFSARLRRPGDHEILLYLLFERQSSPDRWMALRIPRYALQAQQRWPDARGEVPCPIRSPGEAIRRTPRRGDRSPRRDQRRRS